MKVKNKRLENKLRLMKVTVTFQGWSTSYWFFDN